MKLRNTLKRIVMPVLKPLSNWYLSKERRFNYQNIRVDIQPSVFHPGLFLSTKILLHFLEDKPLHNQHFLELGAGSGIISILAAQKGALVTASDINPRAVKNIHHNAQKNSVGIQVIHSNLFDRFPPNAVYDWMVINPPYDPQLPQNEGDMAFFCGQNFEYFQKLFAQLSEYIHEHSTVLMILCEDCDIEKIKQLARRNSLHFEQVFEKKVIGEKNYIFRIY